MFQNLFKQKVFGLFKMGVYISDLHIHSRHSRATSASLDLKNLEKYAKVKGVNLLGTGDFTHPKWISEIKSELADNGSGIYQSKTGFPFVLQSEISLIYTQDGKGRRIHNVVLAPNLDVVKQITDYLLTKGRVDYDGRPIFNIPCPEFVYELKKISSDIEVICAHIWTPHFSLFGEYNQFSKVEDCFKDQTKHIFALETGLSSNPLMNWRLSSLDKYNLVSFSDLHSHWPWRLGREATIFELKELTYDNLIKAIRTKIGRDWNTEVDKNANIKETVEVDPCYGKYHYDGHRNCNVSLSPQEAAKVNNICPVCKRPLTIGVDHRVEELADRELGFKPKNAVSYKTLIPLSELLSVLLGKGVATKGVWDEYYKILKNFKSEYDVLLNASLEYLEKVTHQKIAQAILLNREGKIKVKPGYDGVYGVPLLTKIDGDVPEQRTSRIQKPAESSGQKSLSNF